MNTTAFELHVYRVLGQELVEKPSLDDVLRNLPRRPTQAKPQIISIPADGTPIRLRLVDGRLLVDDATLPDAIAELSLIDFDGGTAVAMTTHGSDVRVNSIPALRLTILTIKDCVRFGAGVHAFLTQRVRPYIGKPPESLLGEQCPYCRIPFDEATQVAVHECNVAYHLETEESHPDSPESERLTCFLRLKHCLSCQQEMRLEERLLWQPSEVL